MKNFKRIPEKSILSKEALAVVKGGLALTVTPVAITKIENKKETTTLNAWGDVHIRR